MFMQPIFFENTVPFYFSIILRASHLSGQLPLYGGLNWHDRKAQFSSDAF